MKKTLLTIFCAMALSVPAMADQVAVTFVDNDHYTGSVPKVLFEANDNPTLLKVANETQGDICTINVTDAKKKAIQASDNPYLLLGKNDSFFVEPGEGVTVTSINFVAPSKNYNVATWEASTGTMTQYSNIRWDWNGTSTGPVKFTLGASNKGPQRIMYIIITYTKTGESGVASITIDENTPVRYYNLQGIELTDPKAGSVVICRQGANVRKMIVR